MRFYVAKHISTIDNMERYEARSGFAIVELDIPRYKLKELELEPKDIEGNFIVARNWLPTTLRHAEVYNFYLNGTLL